jgi:hypothetical protein
MLLEYWLFLDEGKLSCFVFYRKLHKKSVVKTLVVGSAILNIATGQNVFCVWDTLSSDKFKSEESGSEACKKQEMLAS